MRENIKEQARQNLQQTKSTLSGLFYTKEYIESITVITESGQAVFYDLLTGSLTKTSWLDSFSLSKEELYAAVSADNDTHVFSTERAGVYAADTYYLFYIGSRIIDYKNVNKQLGVVVASIDEKMQQEIVLSVPLAQLHSPVTVFCVMIGYAPFIFSPVRTLLAGLGEGTPQQVRPG